MVDEATESQLKHKTKHPAWTFDPEAFHEWLEEQVVEGGELRLDRLHELAKGVVRDAAPITRYVLDSMRFDEEWLVEHDPDDPDADECYAERWYLIVLAPWLRPAPSPWGSWVFRKVLPLAGWSFEDIRALTSGRQIGTLAREYGADPVAAEFGDIWDYGWLDLTEAEEMLFRLWEAEELFLSPPLEEMEREEMERLVEYSQDISREPHEVTKLAYFVTQRTLLTAVERRQALLTIRL